MRKIFLVSIILTFLFYSHCIDFAFKLPRNHKECFSESLASGTLVKATFTSEDASYHDLSVDVYDAQGKTVYHEPWTGSTIKLSFTTSLEGETNICVLNSGNKYIKIYFEFLTGIEAGDLSSAASDADLKPVDKSIKHMGKLLTSLQGTTSVMIRKEEEKLTMSDLIPRKLYILSAITIIVLFVVAFVQVKFIERQLRVKKYI